MDGRGEASVPVKPLLAWTLAIVLALVWLAWWKGDLLRERLCEQPTAQSPLAAVSAPVQPADPEDSMEPVGLPPELAAVEASWIDMLGTAEWPDDLGRLPACEVAEQDLQALCRHLEGTQLVGSRVPGGGICTLLRKIAEDLGDKPPALSSELRSYTTVMANVFHVFRTLGRDRVRLLRDVLREEPTLREPAALILYRWAASRQACGDRSTVDAKSLYQYSGFLLNTLGGQAYLRRRSPEVEFLTSFYSLVVLDQAIERGDNPQGLDPRPELARVRRLVKGRPLLFQDRYEATLDAMSRRWDQRTNR